MLIIIAPISIVPGHKDEFLSGLIPHAERSLDEEPGCLRFDIVQDSDEPNRIWVYEVYSDDKAFEEHNLTSHYLDFEELSKDWRQPRVPGAGAGIGAYNIWPADQNWK